MKLLMWHCKRYEVNLVGLSNRPKDIKPENRRMDKEYMEKCILTMITIEEGDGEDQVNNAIKEIKKFAKDTDSPNIVVAPFVHLSKNIANSENSLKLLKELEDILKKEFKVLRSHFGYDKDLKMEVFGHRSNVRFREF